MRSVTLNLIKLIALTYEKETTKIGFRHMKIYGQSCFRSCRPQKQVAKQLPISRKDKKNLLICEQLLIRAATFLLKKEKKSFGQL